MSSSAPALVTEIEPTVRHALAAVVDLLEAPETAMEDRAAAYAALAGLKLYLHRKLSGSPAQTMLIIWMERERIHQMGALRLKATAAGVKWPCNDPGNWADETVQSFMAELAGHPLFSSFIRHVPDHYEIDTKQLGAAVRDENAAALELHGLMKLRGWRTEESRNLSLELKA